MSKRKLGRGIYWHLYNKQNDQTYPHGQPLAMPGSSRYRRSGKGRRRRERKSVGPTTKSRLLFWCSLFDGIACNSSLRIVLDLTCWISALQTDQSLPCNADRCIHVAISCNQYPKVTFFFLNLKSFYFVLDCCITYSSIIVDLAIKLGCSGVEWRLSSTFSQLQNSYQV